MATAGSGPDICYIDKSSSAELSEAINSMYEWYSRAAVCYAYLADVSTAISIDDRSFRESRWHKRGWTLQELVAPYIVVFLDAAWNVLGTKATLAEILVAVTGVPEEVLTSKTQLTAVSIAERMSWASERETTRLEDEAYCLMGIFGIHIEEIMKRSTNMSLFAWGPFVSDSPCSAT